LFDRSAVGVHLASLHSCSRRHCPQLYGGPPHSILSWFRRGFLFPWRPLPPFKVVQAIGARTSYCTTLVWSPHQQCIWFAHGLGHFERNAGQVGPCSMEVCRFHSRVKVSHRHRHPRWLFFIEGALTVLVAVVAIFVLPDFPQNSHWFLSPDEIRLAELRMQEDVGVSDGDETERQGSRFPGLLEALGDWRMYWLALALTSLVVSLSFNAFFPTLTATLGYSPTVTLLLCAPPWAFATVVAFAVSR